jgi:hypothetical protein
LGVSVRFLLGEYCVLLNEKLYNAFLSEYNQGDTSRKRYVRFVMQVKSWCI